MSRKINLTTIVVKHIATLRDNGTKELSMIDISVFLIFPFMASVALAYFGSVLSDDLLSLAVNFGAITTALLMSVLVLVYEQESKLLSIRHADVTLEAIKKQKLQLLRELYQNICFTIVVSLCVVVSSFLLMFFKGFEEFGYVVFLNNSLTAFVVFLFLNVVLTMLMIIKRFHALITN